MIPFIDKLKLLNSLTKDDMIVVLRSLGSSYKTDEKGNLIFKGVCHLKDVEDSEFVLYYYEYNKNGGVSKKFFCTTECREEKGFDIFTLLQKAYKMRGERLGFQDSLKYVLDITSRKHEDYYVSHDEVEKLQDRSKVSNEIKAETLEGKPKSDKYKDSEGVEPKVLDVFPKLHYQKWLKKHNDHKIMDRFNIRFDIHSNKIIIPHYDISGNLVGIKGISLDSEDGRDKGSSDFIYVEGKSYRYNQEHNFYGLNINKESIIKSKEVIIFEDEKDVIIVGGCYANKPALSIGGTIISDKQSEILHELGVEKITIAFNKRYEDSDEDLELYIKSQKAALEKYKGMFKFTLIVDVLGSIKYGESMLSQGAAKFSVLVFLQIDV